MKEVDIFHSYWAIQQKLATYCKETVRLLNYVTVKLLVVQLCQTLCDLKEGLSSNIKIYKVIATSRPKKQKIMISRVKKNILNII